MEQKIFIRKTEEQVLYELKGMPGAYRMFQGWNEEFKARFLAFCTGKKTLPVLYDTVFKKLMNPDTHPERLEDCISCLLKQKVTIERVLPMEDILMDGESTMVMDILVRLTDGALVLVEIQKIPYYFPAERASCYSADLLLRQYSRVKTEKGKAFSYRDLRKVYTIVFYEQSTEEFKAYGEIFTHHAGMACDSGLELNFLQEFYLVALDVFRESEYAKCRDPKDRLAGWLSFFCTETTEDAEALCLIYPWLSELYAEMAEFGRKPEELMTMFSEMLREMDRNTIRYMVDDMKEKIELGKIENAKLEEQIERGKAEKAELEEAVKKGKVELSAIESKLTEAKSELTETKSELTEAKSELTETKSELTETKSELTETKSELTETKSELTETKSILAEKDAEIVRLKALLAANS